MNPFEQAAEDIESWFGRHRRTSAELPAAAVTINPKEARMSNLLDEIESDVQNFAAAVSAKFQAVDKTALAKMEALAANPGAMQLVDAALGYLHLPPEAFGAAVTVLGEVAKLYVPAQPPVAPEPSFTAAGPQVGGQA